MKKYLILITLVIFLISLFIIMGFIRNNNETETTEIAIQDAKNNVFTKDFYNEIVEIDYWYGDNKIIIDNKEHIIAVYNAYASLELSEFATSSTNAKYGHIIIDFITTNGKIGVGYSSDEIKVNGITYHTNKNIVTTVRDIAISSKMMSQ